MCQSLYALCWKFSYFYSHFPFFIAFSQFFLMFYDILDKMSGIDYFRISYLSPYFFKFIILITSVTFLESLFFLIFISLALLVFVVASSLFSCSIWTLSFGTCDVVPAQGSNPSFLSWEHGVLNTGPSGKSLECHFLFSLHFFLNIHYSLSLFFLMCISVVFSLFLF